MKSFLLPLILTAITTTCHIGTAKGKGEIRLTVVDTNKVKYIEISLRAGKKLLKDQHGILNKEFSKPDMSQVFNLRNGKMLVFGKSACYIYNSGSDIQKQLDHGGSNSIMYNLNYYGKRLPAMGEDAKLKISTLLGLSFKKLDYSEQSVDYIDRFLIKQYTTKKLAKKKIHENVIYFISYAGEVFNRKHNGKWLMILEDDNETWLPYNIANGNRLDLFSYIYSALCDLGMEKSRRWKWAIAFGSIVF